MGERVEILESAGDGDTLRQAHRSVGTACGGNVWSEGDRQDSDSVLAKSHLLG